MSNLIPHRNCPFSHHFVLIWGVTFGTRTSLTDLSTLFIASKHYELYAVSCWCVQKMLSLVDDFHGLFRRHNYNSLLVSATVLPSDHLYSPQVQHLPLAFAVTESDLWRLVTFQVPNFMSIFRYAVRSKGSVRRPVKHFITCYIFTARS